MIRLVYMKTLQKEEKSHNKCVSNKIDEVWCMAYFWYDKGHAGKLGFLL